MSASFSGSLEPLPLRLTLAPEATVWSGPALAVGGLFAALTLIVTESVSQALLGSQTWRSNVSVAGPVGAVNDGVAVLAPLRVTACPPDWVQA